ncbi:MAG: V-type ATPase subunit [Oscillospiraceae bacterium]|jgi:V/A-type H+-transporting ATPase subunit C|nr:V-type ATPase subunit [Oscillospiraceae bacterium]
MMEKTSALAVVPKARAIFSRRLSRGEYLELMRRRTVTELASYLKTHPYFKDSLKLMPTKDLHRAQLESMLTHDIFIKYHSLLRYDFSKDSFSKYILTEAETTQILEALRLIAVGQHEDYITKMPAYLQSKLSFDLMRLAKANTFKEVMEVLQHTPYYKVLMPIYHEDEHLTNLPALECAMLTYYYQTVLQLIHKTFKGREQEEVSQLFLQEAELYNLSLIFRVKTFFPNEYTPEALYALLLPISYKISARKLKELTSAANTTALDSMFRNLGLPRYFSQLQNGHTAPTEFNPLYGQAISLLHFTTSPAAALAAFMCFAKQERNNIINVIEGVRYGLAPEEIERLLHI